MTRREKKNIKDESFHSSLESACEGLFFISETDSDVIPVFGELARSHSNDDVLAAIGVSPTKEIEAVDFDRFFSRLTNEREWFDERQSSNAARFKVLKQFLEKELDDLKVFRVGKIHLTIFAIGFQKDGRVAGAKMNAIET
jgi:hypothetical protein